MQVEYKFYSISRSMNDKQIMQSVTALGKDGWVWTGRIDSRDKPTYELIVFQRPIDAIRGASDQLANLLRGK